MPVLPDSPQYVTVFAPQNTKEILNVFLDFQSHHMVTVENIDAALWRIIARYDDALFSSQLVLDVALPALDIRNVVVEVSRDEMGLIPDLSTAVEKLVGVRVGPGMTKIVRGVIGGPNGSARLAELVLEAMEMLVNALTLPELKRAVETCGIPLVHASDGPKVYLNDTVIGDEAVRAMAANPRLKDSCAAFANL